MAEKCLRDKNLGFERSRVNCNKREGRNPHYTDLEAALHIYSQHLISKFYTPRILNARNQMDIEGAFMLKK